MKSSPVTSETILYRNMLIQERKVQRQHSTIIMIVCITLQALWLFLGGLLPQRGILSLDMFLLLSPFRLRDS